MKFNKYKNKKTVVDGLNFDSKKEANFYSSLKILKLSTNLDCRVENFDRQVRYELIPIQKDENGKTIERACNYTADYVITYANGKVEVIDVKGFKTPDYIIKRKLMLKVHGIRIKEI